MAGCGLVSQKLESAWQYVLAGALQLKKYRENPDVFHKICQVTVGAIGMYYGRDPNQTDRLSRLVTILQSADMHYFYGFLKIPKQLFFSVTAETIDVEATLANILPRTTLTDVQVRGVLNSEVKKMGGGTDSNTGGFSTGYSYASVEEFQNALFAKLKMQPLLPPAQPDPTQPAPAPIADSWLVLSKRPLLERINAVLWGFVDIGVVFLFLNQWQLIDTAKIGMSLGQIKGFGWIKNQVLDTWVWGTCSIGHTINLGLALNKYRKADEGSVDKKYAGRDAVVSLAELFFNGAWFLQSAGIRSFPKPLLFGLAILAKGLGLVNIVTKPAYSIRES